MWPLAFALPATQLGHIYDRESGCLREWEMTA